MIKILDDTKDLAEISLGDNGLGKIEIISGTDTEELNGIYEADFTCSMEEKHFDLLHVEGLVALPTEKGEQIFRIYYISKPLNKIVTVRCRHITYDLNKTIVQPFEATGTTAAIAGIKANVLTPTPFDITTDIVNSTSVFQLTQPRAYRQVLGGYQGSFLDTFRGEYEWDNLEVKMLARRGADRGVRVAYRKNLTGCKMEIDSSATYTSVMAFVNIDNNVVYGSVYHKVTSAYPKVLILDATNDYAIDNIPTAAELTTYAENYANNNDIESPKLTADIQFVPLWQTEEYKDIAPLERVSLGDTIHADIAEMGMSATARVVKTVWNLNTQRYDSLILGSVKSSLASIIQSTVQTARDEAEKATSVVSGQMNEIASLIINGLGLHRTLVPTADGGYKVYLHNHATLADSDVQYYMSANGIMVSTDYGQTWNAGFDAEGNAVLNSLATITLKALEIYGSKIVFGDIDNKYIIADEYQLNGEDVGISFDGSGYVRFQPQETFEVKNTDGQYAEYNRMIMRKEGTNTGSEISFENWDKTFFNLTNDMHMVANWNGQYSNRFRLRNYDSKNHSDELANVIEMTSSYGSTEKNNVYIANYQDNLLTGSLTLSANATSTQEYNLSMLDVWGVINTERYLGSQIRQAADDHADQTSIIQYDIDTNNLTEKTRVDIGYDNTRISGQQDDRSYIDIKATMLDVMNLNYLSDTTHDNRSHNLVPFLIQSGYYTSNANSDDSFVNGDDLNNFSRVGYYMCKSNAKAATLTNCPTSSAFTVRVFDPTGDFKTSGWAYRVQEITTYNNDKFYRTGAMNNTANWTWSAWRRTQTTTSYTYTFGSNSSVVALRSGTTVTLICQINTVDLGSMSAWQTKNICTLNEVYRHGHGGAMLFPVIHDSTMNSGGAIAVYNSGGVQFQTRAGSLPGVSSTAWVNATCTYAVW